MTQGKTTNGLMRHLRDTHNINIQGSKHKTELLNMGYYHGYKGYRFINQSQNRIPFADFDEVVAIYKFDANLKSLLYSRIMMIETAVKNRTLDTLIEFGPADFDYAFTNLLNDYKQKTPGSKDYNYKIKKKLELRDSINSAISYNATKKDVIRHFFHTNKPIPLWAIFEVISLGEFGNFLACLNQNVRIKISEDLKMHTTNYNDSGRMVEHIIFLIKDLRNAVAHNHVVFDCRFKTSNAASQVKGYLLHETSVANITFDTIIDYFILVIMILKRLGQTKTELRKIVRVLEEESETLRTSIPVSIHDSIMGTDLLVKLNGLKAYI